MVQLELLWVAAALMLLGATVSLCLKCQLSATKREKQLTERRSQLESQQTFEVIRSHSTTTQRLEQIKGPENLSIARKSTEALGASRHAGYGSRTESRYQNFLTEDCLRGDAAYVEPIFLDYYNCARFFTPPDEKEEDSHSYQNVIIEVSHSSDLGRCVAVVVHACCTKVSGSAERDGDLLSRRKNPSFTGLALLTSSVPAELGYRGCCMHRADLEHFPFLQENAHGDTFLAESSPPSWSL
ncbi:linker for activation of T-cells family member 2 isoform X1 [Accipiter gentilis]|uniref:linker for activation of T-cells family member 2 isoform X1 n=1 Tax=Astur gentilis TaxID=8957 RepID=UPI002110B862|nr:linker for activation of T-cells family member 2 isoform X1 [Accipiter gentilis]